MSLEHLQPWDNAEYAGLNRLIAQMNKGLFRSGSAFVDVNGANVSIPGGQVSGLTAAQVSGLTQAVVVTGTYIGDDTAPRTINVGFTPRAVLLFNSQGEVYSKGSGVFGGLALQGYAAGGLQISGSGFLVYATGTVGAQYRFTNKRDYSYYYLAFK